MKGTYITLSNQKNVRENEEETEKSQKYNYLLSKISICLSCQGKPVLGHYLTSFWTHV